MTTREEDLAAARKRVKKLQKKYDKCYKKIVKFEDRVAKLNAKLDKIKTKQDAAENDVVIISDADSVPAKKQAKRAS